MIKPVIAAAAALSVSPLAAFAGPYVNIENNSGFNDNDFTGGATDLHVGYEGGEGDLGFYVQAGPAFVHTDSTDDTEAELSGKVGASLAVSEDLSVYGELAGISGEDSSSDDIIDWSGKIGAKFVF